MIGKYEKDMPAWAFLEVASFGTLVSMMGFCAERWGGDGLLKPHYQLKYMKSVRNAAERSSCILNDPGDKAKGSIRISSDIARAIDALGEFFDAVHESAGLLPKSNSARSSSDFMERFATGFDLLG